MVDTEDTVANLALRHKFSIAACALALGLLSLKALRPMCASAAGDDRAAIEKLHQQDVSATLAKDPKALADLFTEDAVLLQPGQAPVVGKKAIFAENLQDQTAHPDAKVLSYKPEIKDLQIHGDFAFEWDTFEASYKDSANGEAKTFRAKALRILQRQPDGSWRFSRVMWNMAEGQ